MNKKGKNVPFYKKKVSIPFLLIPVVCIIVFIVVLFFNRISSLEKVKLRDISEEVAYFEFFDDKNANGIDEYVAFTSYYYFNNYDIKDVDSNEIHDFVLKMFHKDIDVNKIQKVGESKLLNKAHIYQDSEAGSYIYDLDSVSQTDIADIKIYKYLPVSIRKKLNGDYVVKYKKYVIDNPYDILNYYNDNGIHQSNYNSNHVYEYLVGSGKVSDMKKACVKDLLESHGKEKGKLTVTYRVKKSSISIIRMK